MTTAPSRPRGAGPLVVAVLHYAGLAVVVLLWAPTTWLGRSACVAALAAVGVVMDTHRWHAERVHARHLADAERAAALRGHQLNVAIDHAYEGWRALRPYDAAEADRRAGALFDALHACVLNDAAPGAGG